MLLNNAHLVEGRRAADGDKRGVPHGVKERREQLQLPGGLEVGSRKLSFQYHTFLVCSKLGGGDWRLIYRHYATLYFVFCVDSNESELGILDLIQVSLFHSVCANGTYKMLMALSLLAVCYR